MTTTNLHSEISNWSLGERNLTDILDILMQYMQDNDLPYHRLQEAVDVHIVETIDTEDSVKALICKAERYDKIISVSAELQVATDAKKELKKSLFSLLDEFIEDEVY
jgi:hypothetical protein